MRSLSVLGLLAALVPAPLFANVAPPAAPVSRETVPVLPPVVPQGADAATEELAIALQTFASAALAETGRFHEVHVKQVLRMAELEGLPRAQLADPAVASAAARHLGASGGATPRYVASRLQPDKDGWRLELYTPGAKKPELVRLPKDAAEAVERATAAILRAAGAPGASGKRPAKAAPHLSGTASDAAMRAFATCWSVLVAQPMGIENPTVLDQAAMGRAIDACRAAVQADPGFAWAHAALALGLAIRGDDEAAVKELAPLKGSTRYLPPYWIARFWLVTRYQSNEAGAGVLREAIEAQPGFLLARGYLGELLDTVHDYEAAEVAWTAYREVAPDSSFARANLAFTLAKRNRYAESILLAKEALERDPGSKVLKWELAGRFLDAGMVRWAIDLLRPLAEAEDASDELSLRLGEAYFDAGMLAEAKRAVERAMEKAGPDDRRIRRHAIYRLAKIALEGGDEKEAEGLLRRAAAAGHKPDSRARLDPKLMVIVKRLEAEAAAVTKAAPPPASLKVGAAAGGAGEQRPVSPFAVDEANEIRPLDKHAPPPGFDLIRF